MKYHLYSLFFVTCFCYLANAQKPSLYKVWEAEEKIGGWSREFINIDPSGQAIVAAFCNDVAFSGTRLLKYDTAGLLQWKQTYVGPYFSNLVENAATDYLGNTYLSIRDVYGLPGLKAYGTIIKYNSDGNFVWQNKCGDKYSNLSAILHLAIDTSGHVYGTGYTASIEPFVGPELMFVVCLDASTGTELWRYELPGGFLNQNLRLLPDRIQTFDEEYRPEGPFYRISHFDYDGNLLQSYIGANNTGFWMDINHIAANGDIILGGFGNSAYKATRINAQADTIWRYELPGNNFDFDVFAIASDDPIGDTYICGNWGEDLPDIVVTKLDNTGKAVWQSRYGNLDSEDFSTKELAIDDKYVYVSGNIYYDTSKWELVVLLYDKETGELLTDLHFDKIQMSDFKLVSEGFVFTSPRWNTLYDVDLILRRFKFAQSVSTQNPEQPIVEVYPNPAQDMLFVSQPHERPFDRLSLYDLGGRLLKTQSFCHLIAQVDLSGLPSGELVLKMESGSGVSTSRKFVKK